jgi:hypothetical protein
VLRELSVAIGQSVDVDCEFFVKSIQESTLELEGAAFSAASFEWDTSMQLELFNSTKEVNGAAGKFNQPTLVNRELLTVNSVV